MTPAARARQILRGTDGVKVHLDALRFVRALAATTELAPRRHAELTAALDRAEVEIAALARDAERREDDEALRMLVRLGTELAVVHRMVTHGLLSEVRDDGGAASGGRR